MAYQSNDQDIKYLDRNPPHFSEKEARRIAVELFDLEGDFKPLKSERDQNYRIHTASGQRYVLKISNAWEDPGVIDFQIQALWHIERQDPEMPVPRVVRDRDGNAFTTTINSDGTEHIVRALTYLPGVPLNEVALTDEVWRGVGKIAGRLDLALRGFFHPFARQEHPWDITRCEQLRPHTIHTANRTARRNIENVLDRMAADILPRLKRLRHQVIHSDVDINNTLSDPDRSEAVSGVIDFGDMIFAPTVVEAAVAADVAGVANESLLESICAVVAGYDSVLPLEEEEIDLLYDLILARIAITAVIIAWRKVMRPDQPEYIQDSEEPCWETIDHLLTIGRGKVRAKLRDACLFPPYCPIDAVDELPDESDGMLTRRRQVLGNGLLTFYNRPLHVERGRGPWLYSARGNRYLDAYNNVPVAGHCHPHVVKAIVRQTAALNTNTRYIYGSILNYAERLVSLMPEPLSACVFVNSGSEANDIAWRMARFVTGNRGALVMENAYHGITEAIADLSPSDRKQELATHLQTLISPDPYRGEYRYGELDLAKRYAEDVDRAICDLEEAGFQPAAFMVDTAFASNGIPDVPDGYLSAVAAKVHSAGGLLIADEVQAGFGRLGSQMWGFMIHGESPDIVTMGKPIGNGYPLGVVVTRPEILDAFVEETGLFSTFGGNPVACAAGMAVLDVIEDEGLLSNARITGDYLRDGIRKLMPRHEWIGDVRGRGLLVGVELVRDRETQEPAAVETDRVLDLMRENGVLIGFEGRYGNVLKIRPPLVFRRKHADILIEALDRALTAL